MTTTVRKLCVVLLALAGIFLSAGQVSAQEAAKPADDPTAPPAAATDHKKIEEAATDQTTEMASEPEKGIFHSVNQALKPVDEKFETVNGWIGTVIFFPIPLGGDRIQIKTKSDRDYSGKLVSEDAETVTIRSYDGKEEKVAIAEIKTRKDGNSIEFAVLLLVCGAAFFTFRMGFISLRGFGHAISVTAGRYDDKNATGDVSHFQALTTALSATVGLGNIAGVTTAIAIGGPGAAFWMILAGFLGMTSKFVECTLGQKYRQIRSDGTIMGGAMYYLSRGLAEIGLAPLGKIFAIAFAVLCIGGSFAGGNSYQVNGSLAAVAETIPFFKSWPWVYGLIMLVLTAIVIIGGIKRIASTADKIVPIMCGIYVLAGLIILLKNAPAVPAAFASIITSAFSPEAFRGGLVGVLVWGFKRAAFSNEAGVGSAAIAHSAAKTPYPIREGIVALLEPFVDTIIVCTMTALVIVVTGAYDYQNPDFNPAFKAQYEIGPDGVATSIKGAALTSAVMDSQINGFKYVLAFATFMFAYSTMISWSYYGERCWAYLFGDGSSMVYRGIFLVFTFLGSVVSAKNMMDFGDLMIFGMMIPNMIGLFLLSNKVKKDLNEYWAKLKSGEMDREHQERVKASSASAS